MSWSMQWSYNCYFLQIDEQIESMFNSKKRVKDMGTPGTSNAPTPSAGNAEKLEIAKRLALRINAQKNLGAEAQVLVPFHFKVRLFTEQFLFFLK